MAKKCDLCGRSATKGASRSHSKIKTLKRQNINLQSKMIEGLKARLCTSCIRTMEKPKRVKAKRKPALKAGELKALKVKKAGAKSAPKKVKTKKK
ncbi:MAG: bL28 family ribosomal protein [Candidatus Falkowbacteria bacterium]